MTENPDYCIARLFRDTARRYPTFPAIINEQKDDRDIIIYVQLAATVVTLAQKMRSLGVSRNSVVALNTRDSPIALATMLATSLLGCRFVTASAILARQGLIKPTHFFRTPEMKGMDGANFVVIDESWVPKKSADPFAAFDDFEGYADAEDPWMLLHTSGTTGKPKFIALSQRVVADRSDAISEDFPTARTTCAMLFAKTSRPYYARAIGALLNACTIVGGYDTGIWKRNGVNIVFGSPGQFEEIIEDKGIHSHFQKVEVSGAKLTDSLARKLAENFDTIIDIYGSSETNKSFANIVSVDQTGRVVRVGKKLDSEVEIFDSDGGLCEPGKVGTVRVKNRYIVNGYMNAPEATENSFKDGWFYPGDVASWGPNGDLDILGRNDEIISFGGVKIDAQLIDLIIKNTPGVVDAISFKNPKPSKRNEVLAFVVFEEDVVKVNCVAEIRENYKKRTGLPCFLGRLHQIDEVPYTENGRPLRAVCAQMVLERSGEIEEVEG